MSSQNIFKFNCILVVFLLLTLCVLLGTKARAAGPLRVCPANPRYFTDDSGKAIYLTGLHTWNNFQDIRPLSAFNYTAHLRFLSAYNHNFIRLWNWEQAKWFHPVNYLVEFSPMPFKRTGPGLALDGGLKFNLNLFNQGYFDRMRQRIIEAGQLGIYVSIMLFNGFSIETKDTTETNNPWNGHPFNNLNNINGINGDPDQTREGTEVHTLLIPCVVQIEEAYIQKIIDSVNDLDNVLYEICNESGPDSTAWQYYMIHYIKNYEARKPKQHPVGMTSEYPGGNNFDLFASPADWISPNSANYYPDPQASDGTKVILADTDHLCGVCGDRSWVWKSFLSAINPVFMDCYDWCLGFNESTSTRVDIRKNLGYTRSYAKKIDLTTALPSGGLSSTGYCLASNSELLAYQPSGGSFTVDLSSMPETVHVEWLNPSTGVTTTGIDITGGATRTLTPPFDGDAVVYLYASEIPPSSSESRSSSASLSVDPSSSASASISTNAGRSPSSSASASISHSASISPFSSLGSSPASYTIAVTQTSNGTILPGTSVVSSGSSQTFTIGSSPGYQIASVTVDGSSVGIVTEYTFTNVTANHTITAAFTAVNLGFGPLKVSTANRLWFEDSASSKAVLLAGSDTWSDLQDMSDMYPSGPFPWPTYLSYLVGLGHNYTYLWAWEQTSHECWTKGATTISPPVYLRTGPGNAIDGGLKFDLGKFNPAFFNRLRQRCIDAGNQGLYVAIYLFNGFSISNHNGGDKGNPWLGHPYNASNNINNVNGDPDSSNEGYAVHEGTIPAITALQEAYVAEVIKAVNDLGNVLYIICDEGTNYTHGDLPTRPFNYNMSTLSWQNTIAGYIKSYEASLTKQHLVGVTYEYPVPNGTDANAAIFALSNADFVMPGDAPGIPDAGHYSDSGGSTSYPPTQTGTKIVVADTDHIFGVGGTRAWAWKSFLRGMNIAIMDPYTTADPPARIADSSLLANVGYIKTYGNKVNLAAMTPQNSLASTGYCLAGNFEFLVYQPGSGSFTVDLSSKPGTVHVEWFNPSTYEIVTGPDIQGGVKWSFTPPFSGDAVLYLKVVLPTLDYFKINNAEASTASRAVTLNNTATGNPTQYMASQFSSFPGDAWQTYSTSPTFTLSEGNGTKTVYLKARNAAGESNVMTASIILAQLPAVTSFKIDGGAASTITRTVKLNNTATVSPTQFRASEDQSFTGVSWQAYSVAPSFTLSTGSGTKTVDFQVKNSAGPSATARNTIQLIVRPTVTSFQINNGLPTSNPTVTLNNTTTESPTYYAASQYPDFLGAAWKPYSANPLFTLSTGNGLKTVYFKVKNAAGASAVLSANITLE